MLIRLDKLKNLNSYQTSKKNKKFFFREILKLNNYHKKNSKDYANIINLKNQNIIKNIEELPFLPSRLFKNLNLKTINKKKYLRHLNPQAQVEMSLKFFLIKIMRVVR